MFRALTRVKYDQLQLNRQPNKPKPKYQVESLADLTCIALNWESVLLEKMMHTLPVHLVPRLLQLAMIRDQAWAVCAIIAAWPFETLRFADILDDEYAAIFGDDLVDMPLFYYVLEGITSRTKACKLKCIDFRGMDIDSHFVKLIIQTWPMMSMKKSQLTVKKLAQLIEESGGTEKIATNSCDKKVKKSTSNFEITPKMLQEYLDNDELQHCVNRIKLPAGTRLEIKVDEAHFNTHSKFYVYFIISNILRDITPVHVTISEVHIKCEMFDTNVSDIFYGIENQSSYSPTATFAALKYQDTRTLEGLSLQQLDEGMFDWLLPDIQQFTNLQCLNIQDCNIYLQLGVTRSRTATRSRFCKTFSMLKHLCRLDISFNYLIGCLGELLAVLETPLEYLCLRGCDLNETDLVSLCESKHAASLRELNISKLCQFSIYEMYRISPSTMLKILQHFPRMTILNVSQNHLPDSGMREFGQSLMSNMRELKALDISGNIMRFESQMELAKACAQVPTMQWMRLTFMNTALNGGLLMDNYVAEMETRLQELLKTYGREDICVDVVRLSFAILVDLIDFLD